MLNFITPLEQFELIGTLVLQFYLLIGNVSSKFMFSFSVFPTHSWFFGVMEMMVD